MSKEELKLILMIIIENILVCALFIILAVIFKKWWISLFSLITFKPITFKSSKGDKENE